MSLNSKAVSAAARHLASEAQRLETEGLRLLSDAAVAQRHADTLYAVLDEKPSEKPHDQ